MKTVDEVYAAIARESAPLQGERVPADEAWGRVLTTPILMTADSPAFDRSQLDGFAVRSADARAGAKLKLAGRQDAGGAVWRGTLGAGECVGINTGGVFPAGADAVLMVEYSREEKREEKAEARSQEPEGKSENRNPKSERRMVEVLRDVPPGYGVQRRGSDAKAGEMVLEAGMRLGAAQLAAAVASGNDRVTVTRKVRVAVLTTGDELRDAAPGAQAAEGLIRDSNGPMLRGLLAEVLGAAGEVIGLGTCGDVEGSLRAKLERGLREADLLVVTGGMSMGTRDLVPPLLQSLGVTFHVEKVWMKPGKPFVFGTLEKGGERKYVAGMPGNPVSAFVTFQLFVRELLRVLSGERGAARLVDAQAAGVFPANGAREFYQPCLLRSKSGAMMAEPMPWHGSGDVFTLAQADALARRAVGAAATSPGEPMQVLLLH